MPSAPTSGVLVRTTVFDLTAFADDTVPPQIGDGLTFPFRPKMMHRLPASLLLGDTFRAMASRTSTSRIVRVLHRAMNNDGASRHFYDDGLGARASVPPNPCLNTPQDAERPQSPGGNRRRSRLLALRCIVRLGLDRRIAQ